MAGKKLDLGEFAKTLNVGVSKSDTGREQIEYIDIEQIDDDPKNFYELSQLDELAANIELFGLQQPIRVRSNPQDARRVIIVSGHRRRAAIRQLVDAGREDLREIPCIRERSEGSAALQELRLIYANSDTRNLSSAEISKQAERVEALLYQLKEEGYEFPGRMRDHVAEACKVSKTKLARLKVIRDNLIPEFSKYYEAGTLKEASAYVLAQQPPEIQKIVRKYTDKQDIQYLSEWQVNNTIGKIKPVMERKCKKQSGAACTHKTAMLNKLFDGNYGYKPCDRICCDKCDNLASCKVACPLLTEKVKRLRADRRAQNAQEREAKAAKDKPTIEEISGYWRRESSARTASGKSVKQLFSATQSYYSEANEQSWLEKESLQKIRTDTQLPFGQYGFYLSDAHRLIATAKCLGVTADYLLGLSDNPYGEIVSAVQPEGQLAICGWMPGGTNPGHESGWCVCMMPLAGEPTPKALWWDGTDWLLTPGGVDARLQPVAWMRLPEYESSEENNENSEAR